MEIPSFNSLIEQSIIKNWELDALTDYKGATLQYRDVARKIEKLHIIFQNSGIDNFLWLNHIFISHCRKSF